MQHTFSSRLRLKFT